MKARASTADLVAAVRALHQRDPVRLINDPYAIVLCGRYLRRILRIRPAGRIIAHCLPGLRPSMLGVLIRARYAEVALEAAVGAGVTQYVIIGAGLDSFALRRPDLMTRLQVFEIDRAAMQEVKRDRLRRAGVELPREVVVSTTRSIAEGVAPGSHLVVDHMLDTGSAWPEHRKKRERLEAYVAKRGEPMYGDFSLEGMSALMADAGFRTLESVTMMQLGRRYAEELGPLPFEVPGIFACGHFQK